MRQSLLSDLAKTEIELAGLEARRRSVTVQDGVLRDRIAMLASAGPTDEALARALRTAEANLKLYEAKQEEARIAEALDRAKITNVSVAQKPTVPRQPSGPAKAMLLAVGVLLAGLASLVSALGIEYMTRLRVPVDRHAEPVHPLRNLKIASSSSDVSIGRSRSTRADHFEFVDRERTLRGQL